MAMVITVDWYILYTANVSKMQGVFNLYSGYLQYKTYYL
jgi:hypothetical protein